MCVLIYEQKNYKIKFPVVKYYRPLPQNVDDNFKNFNNDYVVSYYFYRTYIFIYVVFRVLLKLLSLLFSHTVERYFNSLNAEIVFPFLTK